jgi:hypothetical protein
MRLCGDKLLNWAVPALFWKGSWPLTTGGGTYWAVGLGTAGLFECVATIRFSAWARHVQNSGRLWLELGIPPILLKRRRRPWQGGGDEQAVWWNGTAPIRVSSRAEPHMMMFSRCNVPKYLVTWYDFCLIRLSHGGLGLSWLKGVSITTKSSQWCPVTVNGPAD